MNGLFRLFARVPGSTSRRPSLRRRTMKLVLIGAALLVSTLPTAASGASPVARSLEIIPAIVGVVTTATDRASYSNGLIRQRRLNVFMEPHACGVVLLRSMCAAALPPELAVFAHTGDRDLIDP